MKPIPCTSGNVMAGSAPGLGNRLTFAENAVIVSIDTFVEAPSSAAEITRDWIPPGLMKYSTGFALGLGPNTLWLSSICMIDIPQLPEDPPPFDQATE